MGEGGGFIEQQKQQMIETSTSYGWEFWLTVIGVIVAIIAAATPLVALYLRYRRKKR
jgi:hypothetical protein